MASPGIASLLRDRARGQPDAVFLRFADGDHTYADVDRGCDRVAAGLAGLGVGAGDMVAVLLPNCPEFVFTWFAATRLGAVHAPVNTAFRGPGLAHALNVTGAGVLVVDAVQLDAVVDIADRLEHVRTLVVRGPARPVPWEVVPFEALLAAEPGDHEVEARELDLAMLLFTSGTTGRSKACMLSHRYAVRQAEIFSHHLGLRSDDVLYCPYPLFHVDAAVCTVAAALGLGATAALGERFSVRRFWDEVRAFGATVFDFMGATLTMLYKRPERPDDADNPIRLAWGVPMPEFADEFERRFDLRLVELYGLTDAGLVVFQPLDQPRRPGACGRPVPPFHVRLLDDDDVEVPVGEVGQIAIRSSEPGLLLQGYYGMPEATRDAMRNGWFHTGDLGRFDADGFLSFVGRGKEAIRRRGENISAFEIEEVVESHPSVLEAAAYGVPSELTEEDVMIAVVLAAGRSLTPEELLAFCEQLLARHMLPRYVDFLDRLPRTPTAKIEKYRLGERGVTETTWDREAI
jgi:crotonobetaine/carnitine-CoA ligase